MNRYYDKFESITRFFRDWVKANCPSAYASWNDYRVVSDEFGGGITIELQWDEGPSEREAKEALEHKFLGVRCTSSWGRWAHQITVHVDERVCY